MHNVRHRSPRTLAYEVNISANTTSAKYTGLLVGEAIHRRIELEAMSG